MNRILFAALLFTGAASAQLTADGTGVYAYASKTLTVPPDQATVAITVTTDTTKTLDNVVGKVRELGLALENLSSILTIPGSPSPVPGVPGVAGRTTFNFTIRVPVGQATATLQRVAQFSQANATEYPAQAQMSGLTASEEALKEAQRKAFPELYREAKARAEQIAQDAGLSAGRVLAVTDTYGVGALSSSIYATFQTTASVGVRLALE